ncbi:putative transcription initiation factor iia gamma chain [Tilletiaria anomala UBC 951]|uniref:Transcription initiation factor IIA subunit 2 n=1 Tax=Tilletiaria anomala (strain ATCC 24038 / CBS 436.72 / UBC 951) TaxID=1037660 RepID=A0A066W0D2_TILAU|nr:putative transcription initiation factor iia gamma chain [Tilletiaria anomala UBC 951]KDN44524.1 putative transcription initiation factor iia gamma chain [Tilletiaria anomala UBC 951]
MAAAGQSGGFYELYRRSSIGVHLTDALDELIQSGHINPVLAMKVLTQFDKSIAETLNKNVKAKCTIKGHLQSYNHCYEVWTLKVTKGHLKMDNNEIIPIDNVKIVACKVPESTGK